MMNIKTFKAETKKEKKCKFPECNKVFVGTGKSCYCEIHRDKMFRKFLYEDTAKLKKEKMIAEDINKIIKHNHFDSVEEIHTCELCNEPFTIKIIHGVYTYPKYCENHRNEFKRKLYLETVSNKI